MRVYNSCVLPVLLYGAECWRMTEKDIKKLFSFHNGCLRRTLKIFWPVKISNENLHEITNSGVQLLPLAMDWTCAKKTNKQHHQGISEMDSRRQKKARASKDHLEKDCRVRN